MIGIYASTELHEAIVNAIAGYDRLEELVTVKPLEEYEQALPNGNTIVVNDQNISNPPDWFNEGPPICFPDVPYTTDLLLGLVFIKLHNFELGLQLTPTHAGLQLATHQYAALLHEEKSIYVPTMANPDFFTFFNKAVYLHYAIHTTVPTLEEVLNAYDEALLVTTDPLQKAYTVRQMATLLIDSGRAENAVEIITGILSASRLYTHALHELKWARCLAWLQLLQVPYDTEMIANLKQDLWEVLAYFEKYHRTTKQGMLLIEAAHIANISESFAEALGYINKAVQLLDTDNQPELGANAQLKKGILLFTWAQKGQPQFYRAAKDALLAALSIFTRDAAPHVFADIHHYLGIIYSEIPDEVQKKSVWAGISVSSFHEALNFYNKVDHPYAFAQICSHFGNAFTKYPAAALGDNYEKALNWYHEALSIRTAESYPLERSLTISNYLDAAWKAGNPGDGWNETRWHDMWEKRWN
jgi:tetratricopeptide (TPR) repeat protein